MRIPKRYGQSKVESCPFCSKQAIAQNSQGISTCMDHKRQELQDVKCMCGNWLELKKGKFGSYFYCIKCGNVNFNRALEMMQQPQNRPKPEEKPSKPKPREITITSDEVDLY